MASLDRLFALIAALTSRSTPVQRDFACRSVAPRPHYARPSITSPTRKDLAPRAWRRRIVNSVRLEHKVGHMTPAEIVSLFDTDTRTYATRLQVGRLDQTPGSVMDCPN